jgi:cell division protein FtsZ
LIKMSAHFELMDTYSQNAVIKVIGIGGGGGNAVEHMLAGSIEGVEFIVANTDAQALRNSSARTVLQMGADVTKGLGAGANPEIGQQAALEDRERIMAVLEGTDMVFITAGMGGGTGTGAAPIFAQVAKELGVLTVAVVTRPFPFEGRKRAGIAEAGLKELREHVDSLIIIPNEKLLSVLGGNTSLLDAFKSVNNVLYSAVQGISELITNPGLINVDFADVTTVMQDMGLAMMGTGSASGEDRASKAAEAAIASPLLQDVDLNGARGILVNMTAGLDMTIGEFEEMGDVIENFASDDATVVIGSVIDPEMSDEIRVTVIVTGVGEARKSEEISVEKVEAKKPRIVAVPPVSSIEKAKIKPTENDYGHFDKPTMLRKKHPEPEDSVKHNKNNLTDASDSDNYFDIPAFLRRQAD